MHVWAVWKQHRTTVQVRRVDLRLRKALNVSLFVVSCSDVSCHATGRLEAINKLVQQAQDDIKAHGCIHGRRVEAYVLDGAGQLNALAVEY